MTNICDHCELAPGLRQTRKNDSNRSPDQFLVCLGQLSTHRNLTIPGNLKESLQSCPDSMGRFEEDHGAANRPQAVEPFISVFQPNRRKAEEGERFRRKP